MSSTSITVKITMGIRLSFTDTYNLQDLEDEVARMGPQLPMAELLPDGIIRLRGATGFFNPDSLLKPSWLKGSLTIDEYWGAIDMINRRTAHTHLGLRKMYTGSERAHRAKLRRDAGTAAIKELNERYKSVRFTYQQTMENVQINTSTSPNPSIKGTRTDSPAVAHALLTILYIVPQS